MEVRRDTPTGSGWLDWVFALQSRLLGRDSQPLAPNLNVRDEPHSEAQEEESSDDFPGWDTMIMALQA